MLHHRTTDPAERADHVAQRESILYYRRTRDSVGTDDLFLDIALRALLEFMGAVESPFTPVDESTARAI